MRCASAELFELRFRALDLAVGGFSRSLGLREIALGPRDLARGLARLGLGLLDGFLRLGDALALRFLLPCASSRFFGRLVLCAAFGFPDRLRAACGGAARLSRPTEAARSSRSTRPARTLSASSESTCAA